MLFQASADKFCYMPIVLLYVLWKYKYWCTQKGLSDSYFIKINTFRLHTCKLLGKRRKTNVLYLICNRFYFGEVQEEVLGQCSGQGISVPRVEGISVYQWSVPEKNQARWLRKCLCKYFTEVSRFVLEILEKSKVIASVIP